ncbi:ABC transporter ATP-binding protein [Spiroplasma clarkii]|uniref:ABC transporter ATP-binding protein n=1 Tax=Spiroplasma clarkii TaxID=2139 RepID=A0A1Y0L160_9MOLU|nr:ATP-binding cassette domain-containing protein [Spiroplasma clarkii]ARU91737.1 ABC transporter ATP-binding protein [Spiroplasma clarkii]ATX71117.1 ABC transporter ATP-binding protein [Spiroplasma clarkii]
MINIKNVSKHFQEKTANKKISIEVKPNEIFGILGPNGAGKTTLIRQVLGFIKPDSGEILINNVNPWNNSKKLMLDVGYLAGEIATYDFMTGREFIDFNIKFKQNTNKEFLQDLIDYFDFEPSLKTKIKRMSKGTKQKVSIIVATMNKPKFLILDEPTSGLDPVMQDKFNKLILKLKKEGTTVLLCSHMFAEVIKLCERACFIKDGTIIREIATDSLSVESLEKDFLALYSTKELI